MEELAERLKVDHYFDEKGLFVMTERAHIKRGSCCGSGCLHCPYAPRHGGGGRRLAPEVAALAPASTSRW
ncbi:MAG: DUF5522 domain-containing protein [Acidobacteriota bacterium]|nr:DUF5522 domain-containing protein [Acidobacteriota bacterium]